MLARALLLAAGVVTTFAVGLADMLGLDPTPGWGPVRRLEFCIGLSLLTASYFLYSKKWQLWFVRRYGVRLNTPGKIAAVLFARVILLVTGVASTFLVLTANFFGLVRQPEWTTIRFFHLIGALLLLICGTILCIPSWQQWIFRKLGVRWFSPAQVLITLFGLIVLILPGAFVVFLALNAEWLGLDRTPGMGKSRIYQFWIGLCLLVGGIIFLSRHAQIWVLHRLGTPLQTGPEVARALIARLCVWLLGLSLIFLSLAAKWIGLTRSGNWDANRLAALSAGLAFIIIASALSSRRARRWLEHWLQRSDKIPLVF
jgi:hypothetical protein